MGTTPNEYKTPLRDLTNVQMFNMLRKAMPMDFQRRVPEVTKATLAEQIQNVNHMYAGKPNEFVDALVNRIGSVIARDETIWHNPLEEFKLPGLTYGSVIEEYKMGLLEAHVYEHDRESMEKELFGTELPQIETNFHTITRQEKYKVSTKEDILRRAFLDSPSTTGFVEQLLNAPITSDNWDEFLQTVKLFSEYEANGGFYHMRIPNVSSFESGEAEAKAAIRRMRGLAHRMPFLSHKYNAAHMPSHANPDDLILFCTPEFQAAIDVEALAGAFNMEKLSTTGRVITIPREHFGIDHCEAILTTKSFFVIADTLKQNTSMFNPANLMTNYWLHHHSIISASRFVPAVMFSTVYDDEVIEVKTQVTGMGAVTIEDKDGEAVTSIDRGDIGQMLATPTGTGGAEATGVMWSVEGATSARTYITGAGVLHVGGDEGADSLTVKATSAWTDPASPYAAPFEATLAVAVTGEQVPEWPVDHTDAHADDA